MRPKRVILLVKDDEQELSVLAFMFKTNSFRVISTTDPLEAASLFADNPIHLVIAGLETPKLAMRLAGNLKRLDPFVPIILFEKPEGALHDMPHGADMLLDKATSPAELLDWAKQVTARKRGPRKGTRRKQSSVPERLEELHV